MKIRQAEREQAAVVWTSSTIVCVASELDAHSRDWSSAVRDGEDANLLDQRSRRTVHPLSLSAV